MKAESSRLYEAPIWGRDAEAVLDKLHDLWAELNEDYKKMSKIGARKITIRASVTPGRNPIFTMSGDL